MALPYFKSLLITQHETRLKHQKKVETKKRMASVQMSRTVEVRVGLSTPLYIEQSCANVVPPHFAGPEGVNKFSVEMYLVNYQILSSN